MTPRHACPAAGRVSSRRVRRIPLVAAAAALASAATLVCGTALAETERTLTKPEIRAEIGELRAALQGTVPVYRNRNFGRVRALVGRAYLQHFEDLEGPLEKVDDGLKERLERAIAVELRQIAAARRPLAAYRAKVTQIVRQLPVVQRKLGA